MQRKPSVFFALMAMLSIGFGGGFYYGKYETREAISVGNSIESAKLIELEALDVEKAYKSGEISEQMYGLEHFVHLLEHLTAIPNPLIPTDAMHMDLAFTYTRLGLLNQKIKQFEKANSCFTKAVFFYKKTGKDIDIDTLIRLVSKIDKNL